MEMREQESGTRNQEPGTGTGDRGPGKMADKIRDYRDLRVWQRAMELVVEWYSAVRRFPKCEVYALSLQLQRAAVSVHRPPTLPREWTRVVGRLPQTPI
jgi:23S rRNA-intervening sequence protein